MIVAVSISSLTKYGRKMSLRRSESFIVTKTLKRCQFAFSNSFSVFASVYKIKIKMKEFVCH